MPDFPPAYPRIPRLTGPADDDLVVDRSTRDRWLTTPVRVEEKLDGSNVSLWLDDGMVEVAGRAGPGAMDRAGQLGRLRAWAGARLPELHDLLTPSRVAYAEWLWLEHSIAYTRLPDHVVLLDVWTPERGFVRAEHRDELARRSGLAVPAVAHHGVVGHVATLRRLTDASAYRDGPAEGVVLRHDHADGRFDRCKWIREDFRRRSDRSWQVGSSVNRVAAPSDLGQGTLR